MTRRPKPEKRRHRALIGAAVVVAIWASEIPAPQVAAMPVVKLGSATTADLVDHAYWRHHYRHWHWWFPHFWFRPPWPWYWGWRYHRHHYHHHAPATPEKTAPDQPVEPASPPPAEPSKPEGQGNQ
jgi:hypothetical protein